MNTAIFVGFRHEGTIKGCTWQTNMDDYTPRKEKILDLIRNTDINYARDIFQHIEWKPFEDMLGSGDGICVIDLIKSGVDGYVQNTKKILKFLSSESEVKYDMSRRFSRRVKIVDGKFMFPMFNSAPHFYYNEYDIAFIFDLDAGKVEVIHKQPTLVD